MFKINNTNKINILLYHQIGDKPNKQTNLDCFCKTKQFYLQMEFLMGCNYKVISLSKAMDLIFNKRFIDEKYIVLTFDDGCEKFYDTTFPILQEFNFPSAIYPVASYLGKYASWSAKNNPELKILSKNMVIELSKLGVEIGSHTLDHLKLTQINKADAFKQVKESKEILEQLISKRVTSFAYPHGDYNYETIEIVKELGFSNALTCIANCAEKAQSPFEIPRKYITYFDDVEKFKQKID